MRAAKHRRHSPAHGVFVAVLTTGSLTAALLATALLATSASAPAALTRTTATRITSTGGGTGVSSADGTTPGWRVVAAIGPDNQSVTGSLTARSATDAWSVWTGTRFTAVDRLAGGRWTRVTLPAKLDPYVRSAVAFDGDSATDFWLFSSYRKTQALRFTGGKWTTVPIPSWVLRSRPEGGLGAVAAAFGPGNVWVFSLGAGREAAHYDGRSWAKVSLPAAPTEVSAASADDIWALAGSNALHWNGRTWAEIKIPAAGGKRPESFGDLTVAGPGSVWVWRTIGATTPGTDAAVLRWDGTRWRKVADTPADIIDSVTPDGAGGLWASGLDVTPGGFNYFFHLAGGRWTQVNPPAGVWDQETELLTWIPGTRSLWGTAANISDEGSHGVLIKYGP